jgi:predicted nucleic-acid-binding protein
VIVIVELVSALESCYGSAKVEVVAVLQRILRTRQLVVQDAETIWKSVRLFEASKANFADCLIERIGAAREYHHTSTFDKYPTRTGMRLIE